MSRGSKVITEEELAELLETPVQVVRNNSCDLSGRGERVRRHPPSKRQIDSCLFDRDDDGFEHPREMLERLRREECYFDRDAPIREW